MTHMIYLLKWRGVTFCTEAKHPQQNDKPTFKLLCKTCIWHATNATCDMQFKSACTVFTHKEGTRMPLPASSAAI